MVEDHKKRIGEALRLLRHQSGLTQDDVSKKINIKRATYSAWERGQSSPSIDILHTLAHLYDVSVDDIITGKYAPKSSKHLPLCEKPPLYSAESRALVALTALQILEDHDPEKSDITTRLMADTLVGIALLVYGENAFPHTHHVMSEAAFLAKSRLLDIRFKNHKPD